MAILRHLHDGIQGMIKGSADPSRALSQQSQGASVMAACDQCMNLTRWIRPHPGGLELFSRMMEIEFHSYAMLPGNTKEPDGRENTYLDLPKCMGPEWRCQPGASCCRGRLPAMPGRQTVLAQRNLFPASTPFLVPCAARSHVIKLTFEMKLACCVLPGCGPKWDRSEWVQHARCRSTSIWRCMHAIKMSCRVCHDMSKYE